MVNYSVVSAKKKEMIAGDNLRRLLGIESHRSRVAPEGPLNLKDMAALSRSLEDELVIDSHTQMGPHFDFHIPDNDAGYITERRMLQ